MLIDLINTIIYNYNQLTHLKQIRKRNVKDLKSANENINRFKINVVRGNGSLSDITNYARYLMNKVENIDSESIISDLNKLSSSTRTIDNSNNFCKLIKTKNRKLKTKIIAEIGKLNPRHRDVFLELCKRFGYAFTGKNIHIPQIVILFLLLKNNFNRMKVAIYPNIDNIINNNIVLIKLMAKDLNY